MPISNTFVCLSLKYLEIIIKPIIMEIPTAKMVKILCVISNSEIAIFISLN
jgi:hypothetical protein